jgi:hypothetical protein
MNKEQRKAEFLRKLIDLPRPIVSELQKLARESDRSLKSYIEELIVNDVRLKSGRFENGFNHDGNETMKSHNSHSVGVL